MFRSLHRDRKNKTLQWCPSDTITNYNPKQKDGKDNYKLEDFDYQFNSDGFRCDDFSTTSDLPILFMGCSITEGIGLPLNHCWPHFLLEKIRALPENQGKKIPFHSIALGGAGVDTMARILTQYVTRLQPKIIFLHMSSVHRREYLGDDMAINYWIPNFTNEFELPARTKLLDRLYSDDNYALFCSIRSLETISVVAKLSDAIVYLISDPTRVPVLHNSWVSRLLPNIKFISSIETFDPNAKLGGSDLNYARDNMHPGKHWQKKLADSVWKSYSDPNFRVAQSELEAQHDAGDEIGLLASAKIIQRRAVTK